MSDDEEYVPVPRNERSRKYIPLGNGSSQRKPKTHPDSSPQINSLGISGITNVTSSFCVDQPPRQVCKIPPPLPDIYTTCPELRTFKLAISLESIPKFNSIKPNLEGSTFDPNKKILKPFVSSNVIDFFLFLIFSSPFCFFRCSSQIDLPQA
ncbi:hypothetical protein TRFO_20896 [Tritrichomonas foetus]|uniref:Uncharacterized protein n=1 Tax=Tritrichomonas foetus TaxID=1144522 RepID=A0A1J4KJZ1_9EUKA|nr:hypothetical protein TRFO_20896 [Tritrichomonas foetus]|eukprot:OHT09998.1 hypothetical protein TRFO_20896 [Tritrichomonas foetus]